MVASSSGIEDPGNKIRDAPAARRCINCEIESTDGGKTWNGWFDGYYTRREARAGDEEPSAD
jgi:hypothetical protein